MPSSVMIARRLSARLLPALQSHLLRWVALASLLLAVRSSHAEDWPLWRGPNFNGISAEKNLIDNWDPKGGADSHLLWKSDKLAGRSTPIVMGGKLYVLVRDQPDTETEGEKVVCADAATGELLWEHRFNVYLSDVPAARVGWSSVVGDPKTGHVYALGVCGYFCCLNGETGKVVWERSLSEELGFLSTYEGGTSFPILYEDTVILSAAMVGWGNTPKWGQLAQPAHRFMSFDKATGEMRWLSGTQPFPYDTTYSTPALTTLGGQRAMVFGTGDGAVWAMQPGTGKRLWKYQLSRRGLNVSPVVDDKGHVYTGHSEENIVGSTMGGFVAIDGNKFADEKADEKSSEKVCDLTETSIWKKYELRVGKSSPLVMDGRVYAVTDSATLLVLNAESGEEIARKSLGRVMRGSPVYADGKIYVGTRGGHWWVLRPTASGVEVVHELTLHGEQIDASPVVADGRIYLTTSHAMHCLADPATEPPTPSEATPAEPRKILDKRIAQTQLVPCDAILTPGEKCQYRARLFNAAGDFIREAAPEKVAFGVAGPGKVTPEGIYKAPSKAGHQAALILCEVAGLSAEARLRIVPPLPWSFDFEGKNPVPLTWIGGRRCYVPRESSEGNHYLTKLSELPTSPDAPTTKIGTRSRMLMGPSTLSNYTIQADIQLQKSVTGEADIVKLPTAGLINSRYTFALFGTSNEVSLQSWCAHDKRTQTTVPMDLKAGVWYRMKLSVFPNPEENTSVVQAKVWRRGKAEPGAWTLELTDKAPNLQGSPGLFGDTKEAEFYVDNLTVTPNE